MNTLDEMIELVEALRAAGVKFEMWDLSGKGWFFLPGSPNPTLANRNGNPKPFYMAAVAMFERIQYITGIKCGN